MQINYSSKNKDDRPKKDYEVAKLLKYFNREKWQRSSWMSS